MSEQEREGVEDPDRVPTEPVEVAGEEESEAPSTPFDSPWFLPVLLWPLSAWFGYDGWFNAEIEAVGFNQVGFGLLILAAIYYTIQAVRETRSDAESE